MSYSHEATENVKGRQEPRICLEPKRSYTDGEDAAILSSSYGLTPDPWQAQILNAWLGRDESDKYTASRAGVLVPRQNGKNGIIEMRELYGLTCLGEKILHTAHEVKTARKAFLRLASFFENEREYPELAALVSAIRRTNGQEAILLINGASVEFSARSRGAARGFTVDVVVCDEAQELTDEQLEALMPTMSAAPLNNPQLIMTGTPPNSEAVGHVFGRMKIAGEKGEDTKLSWHEWSVSEIGDVHDVQRIAACNPAIGYRLRWDTIMDELAQMSEDGFARERLSWWNFVDGLNRAIDKEQWEACATNEPPEDGKTAYGVKFSPDGAVACLAVAVQCENRVHIEVVMHQSMNNGVGWLVEWLQPRLKTASTVAIDGLHWQGSCIEKLREAGVKNKLAITVPDSKDVITASSMILDAISDKKVTHFNQQALNRSATEAVKRTIGDKRKGGWGFGGEVDTTLIEAATLAHWAVITCKRNPKRKQVIL